MTQSGSGIGREAAFSLAEAGAKVVVFADMNLETAKKSSEESKKYASNKDYETTTFEMNVQDDKSVQDMVDFVIKEFGSLDYAVNAAGVGITPSIDRLGRRLMHSIFLSGGQRRPCAHR